ncbi:MAG TPA: Co2+/Mg2+ efflux protein ApaG [Myxococcaceae bacterium]|jgi:ApaG protein|nr:Co2+/Mg2+ efflux protein ApaG [Myxococcaceae bacterium]
MSSTTTEGVKVTVRPSFWPERSSPESGQFAFRYLVQLDNLGPEPAQLRTRHWVISDADGHVEEVRGEGVVGKQPFLNAGEHFEYASWVMLRTPFGTMRGSFQMERPDGRRFDARIAEFPLTQPHALH